MHSRPASHPHSLSPLWVCQSYQEPCFYLTWGSLQIHNLLFFSLLCRSVVSPSFFLPFSSPGVIFMSLGLFRYCLFLIAPVASLLLLVAVMIWFSHFPICCNNFILSHLKDAYRQTPCLMCEQKMRREMMHCSHRLIQALCTNQHFKSNGMEMGLRGSWVRSKPRGERCKQEESKTNLWAGTEPSGVSPPPDKPPPTSGHAGRSRTAVGASLEHWPCIRQLENGMHGSRWGKGVQCWKFWTQSKEDKANE